MVGHRIKLFISDFCPVCLVYRADFTPSLCLENSALKDHVLWPWSWKEIHHLFLLLKKSPSSTKLELLPLANLVETAACGGEGCCRPLCKVDGHEWQVVGYAIKSAKITSHCALKLTAFCYHLYSLSCNILSSFAFHISHEWVTNTRFSA